MSIRPDAAPAQQLLAMRWAELNKHPASGRIFTSTRTLIKHGYVTEDSSGLEVWLTDEGRAWADAHATPQRS